MRKRENNATSPLSIHPTRAHRNCASRVTEPRAVSINGQPMRRRGAVRVRRRQVRHAAGRVLSDENVPPACKHRAPVIPFVPSVISIVRGRKEIAGVKRPYARLSCLVRHSSPRLLRKLSITRIGDCVRRVEYESLEDRARRRIRN